MMNTISAFICTCSNFKCEWVVDCVAFPVIDYIQAMTIFLCFSEGGGQSIRHWWRSGNESECVCFSSFLRIYF